MAFKKDSNFKYEIIDDFDHIIEEKGNTFMALRRIRWGERETISLDLRKYHISSDGDEVMGKGVSFQTEEGPNNLIKVMIMNGYGKTQDVLEGIKDRDDFRISLNKILGKDDEFYDNSIIDEEEEFYVPDMSTMLD